MRKYELTYLIADEVPESDLNKVTGQISGYISNLGGKIAKEEIWGRRKLAYAIKKNDFATYVTLFFDLPAENMREFERELKLTEKILRHLLIVKDFGSKDLTLSAEDIAETEAIKEVIGGEKSFEAVEGETEESKDLMATRSSEELKAEPVKEEIVEEKVEEEPVAAEEPNNEKKTEEAKSEKPKAEKKEKKPAKKAEKSSDEADRLSKLNEELDDILKDEL